MQGYVRVSPAGSTVALVANISAKARAQMTGGPAGSATKGSSK